MKDYDNLIIKRDDPRYGKLGHLWKKYNWDNVVRVIDTSWQYYLPHELLLRNYHTSVYYLKYGSDGGTWVTRFVIERILNVSCDLTSQDYFDLIILHINNIFDRPRCCYCHKIVNYGGRISWGYNQTYYWNEVERTYCCNSHAKLYQAYHPDEFPDQAYEIEQWMKRGWEYTSKVKARMNGYLSLGEEDDPTQFYLAKLGNGGIKYGITRDIDERSVMELMNGNTYKDITILVTLPRKLAAYLEASIKLKFEGREYLEDSELNKFIEIFKNESSKDIINPFE